MNPPSRLKNASSRSYSFALVIGKKTNKIVKKK